MAGQVWVTNTLGGYMSSKNLSKELRFQTRPLVKFRQFAGIEPAVGKNAGETFTWNVYSKVATAGGTLTETSTMPQTNFNITQGTMTITERGNSVPYTGKLDDLSEQPIKKIIQQVLRNDAKEVLDVSAYAQFAATPMRFVATTATDAGTLYTNGTATGTNAVALGKNHVKVIVDTMKELNIPPYMADDYMSVAHPTTFRQLKNDLESVHQYVDRGFQMILNGEIGRYEGCRFIEQNNVGKENWTGGKSNQAFFFGDDAVAEGVAIPEEIRGKIPDDYGRGRGIAWYSLGGFGLSHTSATDPRIVKWDSQT